MFFSADMLSAMAVFCCSLHPPGVCHTISPYTAALFAMTDEYDILESNPQLVVFASSV
jgi:hypothetical protein